MSQRTVFRSCPLCEAHCGVGVELDAETPLIPVADRAAQPRDAFGYRIAVRVGPLHALDQLVDDVPRRGPVGIAHAEVDDVLAAATRCELQLAGDVENVRRQARDAGEFFHG